MLTPKVCYYYHLLLHCVTTTGVQMAALVPEIMDGISLIVYATGIKDVSGE
jgi:hypothetical protein